jgi:hypothetical protein
LLGFNYLLEAAGVDIRRARLLRHQSGRAQVARAPYDLWRSDDGRFELYQRIQSGSYFKDCRWIASFVATPWDETLFVGVYLVGTPGVAPPATFCPVTGKDETGAIFYDLQPSEQLSEFRGRILVDWGKGYRTWVQRPDRNDKPIVEIRRQVADPPFPGFLNFTWPIRELAAVPRSWAEALTAIGGVYLLVCRTTGRQYIGSAYGAGGFWYRWQVYLQTGHGNNEAMRLLESHDFQVSVLECAPPHLTPDEVIRLENRWKDKLQTRAFGLNRN